MIVYDLRCDNDHVFEAWFKDSAACDRQRRAKKLICPTCGSTQVVKAPMAPHLARSREVEPAPAPEGAPRQHVAHAAAAKHAAFLHMLRQVREHVEQNFEDVADRFPEEARKIHHGETEDRAIYGSATPSEAEALKDEGIEIQSIPWVPTSDA